MNDPQTGRNRRHCCPQECEAVEHGQQPCPLQYDDEEHWCLSCLAKKAAADYFNG